MEKRQYNKLILFIGFSTIAIIMMMTASFASQTNQIKKLQNRVEHEAAVIQQQTLQIDSLRNEIYEVRTILDPHCYEENK